MTDLLAKLAKTNIPIRAFILDDGWHNQRTYRSGDASPYRCKTGPEEKKGIWELRGLWDFDANSDLHPDGLKGSIKQTKQMLGDSCEVGVWLAYVDQSLQFRIKLTNRSLTGGYWDGIHPESPLIKRYSCKSYPTSRDRLSGTPNIPFTPSYIPGGKGELWLPPPSASLRYWTDWFTYIRSCGATFLKVDVQAALVILDGQTGAECQYALWDNMLKASNEIFGQGRVIHCMSQSEGMYGGVQGLGLLTNGEKIVWRSVRIVTNTRMVQLIRRNSDDFGLEGKKEDVQQQHIFTNLTNSLLTNHLALIPDPDMFMTADQAPLYHALLRVMYPGPLLLSDRPGQHDLDLIARMTARDAREVTQVVRTEDFARPLASRILDVEILGSNTGRGLWAASRTAAGGAIIGVWNARNDISKARVEDTLTVEDLRDALNADLEREHLVVEVDLAGKRLRRGKVVSADHTGIIFEVRLETLEAACFWVVPVIQLVSARLAVLGLIDKVAGASVVDKVEQTDCQ